MQKQSQQIELLTMTAEQRYMQMLEQYPDILLNTASKHIASYLGISPESLSRIKKKAAS
jgi:CRP-like cAMP-binding protein